MLHPELARFQRRLESAGTIVAAHADHLCVRLPLLISLRVRYDGERLAFDPRFGAASRGTATITTFGVMNAAILGAALGGVALPLVVAVGTIGVMAAAYEGLRYIVTESAITRVTLLWGTRDAARADEQGDAVSAAVLGSGPAEPLRAGAAADTPRVHRRGG
jgi:hypothetical protein